MSSKVIAWIIGMPCAVALFGMLMACLWEYRLWVGISLLLLTFAIAGVVLHGMIIENNLRIYRFNHQQETPLTLSNQPMVLRPDMRENPALYNGYQPQPYQGYQHRGG